MLDTFPFLELYGCVPHTKDSEEEEPHAPNNEAFWVVGLE